jgi:hypothetical protein
MNLFGDPWRKWPSFALLSTKRYEAHAWLIANGFKPHGGSDKTGLRFVIITTVLGTYDRVYINDESKILIAKLSI